MENPQDPKQEPVQDQKPEEPKEDPKPAKHVPLETHEKLLSEKKHWAEKARLLEAKLEEEQIAKMKEKEDIKGLNETYAKKIEELNKKLQQAEEADAKKVKYAHVKKEWQKLGLNDDKVAEKLFSLVNLDAIKIDRDLNVVLNHEEEAKRVYEDFKPIFGASAPRPNHAAPQSAPVNATIEEYNRLLQSGEWKKMSKADQHAFTAKIYEAGGVKVKSRLIGS